ncbi:PREDICTED: probable mediator of RNA polymerase II transcription subunit 26b [Tarenaya hassleriana]|uniref:probable mediator of RNA polymerase II transcription subunit 26b n=1 Tax=Tarenaya hassleriana TaxID=28532 RepID=UPI00053C84C2|nr:PREDICTED: probable mediator of RNA polymerase II transcription subunit 26b [Tarenaya hassleriana]
MTKMKQSGSLDSWRDYFRQADSDIFEIIDHAIMVAAADCPKDFKSRRDRIAELLFSCRVSRCTGCDHLELSVPGHDEANRGGRIAVTSGGGGDREDYRRGAVAVDGDEDYDGFGAGGSKESEANSSRGDNHIDERTNLNNNQIVSNYSYGEAEALTDEIEETTVIVGEVTRIKDILLSSEDQSKSSLFESLQKLQLMSLSVDVLKATEIGKAVNGLRKHGSDKIRQLAKTLIAEWKELVDQWVNTTKEIAGAGCTPESANPSVIDEEEGLPSPPMDEGALFATGPIGLELGQFFDGMEDFDRNPRNSGEYNKNNRENNGRKPQNIVTRRPEVANEAKTVAEDKKSRPMQRQEAPVRTVKPSVTDHNGQRRALKQSTEQRTSNGMLPIQKSERPMIQRRPLVAEQKRNVPGVQQEKLKGLDNDAKLEVTKRKLQESYQQHEKAKRQRTVQMLETIPKQGNAQKPQIRRPGMNNRPWANGRR